MTSSSRITVVIPARNAATHLEQCLRALRAQSDALPIVVVDNGSEDHTADVGRRGGATVVNAPGVTVSQARNLGATLADSNIVAFVDADNEVTGRWLEACVRAFEDAQIGAAGLPYSTVPDATWVQRAYDALRPRPKDRVEIAWLGAGNLAVRKSAFDAVGGFDEALQTCEDVAFCTLLRSRGYKVLAEPDMTSVHHGDPRTLRALFLGELWRGRDNVRVTFRPPVSFRSIAGLSVSLGALLGAVLCVAGVVSYRWTGAPLAISGLMLFAAAASVRTFLLWRGSIRAGAPVPLASALLVGGTYELARGCALLFAVSHDTRATRRLVKHEA